MRGPEVRPPSPKSALLEGEGGGGGEGVGGRGRGREGGRKGGRKGEKAEGGIGGGD